MKKTARILYFIVGCVFPILIGLLHTYVHFKELTIPSVQNHLSDTLTIMGKQVPYYNSWGLVSFMMGASFIVIGLLNLGILSRLTKNDYPPVAAILAMMTYLSAVIYVGITFNAAEQFYGGIFGIVLSLICLFLSVRKK